MNNEFNQQEPQKFDYNKPTKRNGGKGIIVISIILASVCALSMISCFGAFVYAVFNGVRGGNFGYEDPWLNVSIRDVNVGSESMTLANTVEAVEDSVVAIGYTEDCGNGSGVIISKDGFIVTNNHVVNGYEELYVALNDGTVHSAYVWATDEQTDLAVIKINTDSELSAAVFGNSSEVRKGESVIVIGNPTGELKGSVSAGIISHDSRIMSIEGNIMELIQTDASVNPGNSGGGLFNTYGELIGIVNAKIVATTVESIGFAIPSNNVLAIVEDLLEYKYVTGRPYVGLNMKVVTKATYGGFVTEYIVTESKYCEDIKPGDKILSVGGKNIGEYTSQQLLYGYSIGDEIEIVLIRDSKTIVVTVVLQEYRP